MVGAWFEGDSDGDVVCIEGIHPFSATTAVVQGVVEVIRFHGHCSKDTNIVA